MTYLGDNHLEGLLREAGVPLNAAAVRDAIRGVQAAPPPLPPESWMDLIGPGIAAGKDSGLHRQLKTLHDETLGEKTPEEAPDRQARLDAFRGELGRLGLAGFIVPRGDEHQGEYVAKGSERLAWLTGFGGSAGSAVVLGNRAALFIDGRYTLQARSEVDADLFNFRPYPKETPAGWIEENLNPHEETGIKFGYDPWLHTPNQAARLRSACEKCGAVLSAVDANPIDTLWRDRPAPPLSPARPLGVEFSGEASTGKRLRIAKIVAAKKAGAMVLSAPDSIAWLLNLRGGDVPYTPLMLAFAVLHKDGALDLFTDPRKLTLEARGHLGGDVRPAPSADFGPALDALGRRKSAVLIDPAGVPDWVASRLKAAGARPVHGTDPCAMAKAVKNETELNGTAQAHRRDGAALTRFLAWLSRAATGGGLGEIAAAQKLDALRADGDRFRGPSFPTISAAGPNAAVVHYRAKPGTEGTLEDGGLYLVDSGGQYLDGTTDVTRTVAIGRPSAEMRDRFTRVLKGHIALAGARFPKGTTGSQLDALARRALWEAGLDYDHGTGHGVGCYLGVHEGPQRISKRPEATALEPGMVLSIEPGYYKSGSYGIRIENLVAVVSRPAPKGAEHDLYGFEALTLAPIDRSLIATEMLTKGEIDWIDAYHARVREALAPLLCGDEDGDASAWLEKATLPL